MDAAAKMVVGAGLDMSGPVTGLRNSQAGRGAGGVCRPGASCASLQLPVARAMTTDATKPPKLNPPNAQ